MGTVRNWELLVYILGAGISFILGLGLVVVSIFLDRETPIFTISLGVFIIGITGVYTKVFIHKREQSSTFEDTSDSMILDDFELEPTLKTEKKDLSAWYLIPIFAGLLYLVLIIVGSSLGVFASSIGIIATLINAKQSIIFEELTLFVLGFGFNACLLYFGIQSLQIDLR